MNKVTALIKTMMLTYPMLYPTRDRAMIGIFLSTNYRWNRKGEIVPEYPIKKDFEGPIDISDLTKNDTFCSESFGDFGKHLLVRNELERLNRLYRAEHIDHFAEYGDADSYGYNDLDNWYLDSARSASYPSVLFAAPFGKIDPDWAHAMERFISDMQVAFNQVFLLHYDRDEKRQRPEPSMFSLMPEKFQNRYTSLMEVSDKLEAQTGSIARAKAMWAKRGPEIMAEITKED